MRYIIRRIIIGVGIALALMFITQTFNLKVYAQTNTIIPDKLRMTYGSSSPYTTTEYDIQTINFNQYPSTPFYGKSATGNGIQINALRFHYTLTSGMSDGYYNVSLLFNITYMNSKEPPTFMLHNNGNWFTGQSRDSFIFSYTTGYDPGQLTPVGPELPKFWTVTFKDIYLKPSVNSNVYFMVYFDDSNANMSTGYGVTATTFQLNSDSAVIDAQQETTNAVNDLNDSINDDDSSDAQSSGSSFFSNFSNTDHGGLSGIVTAPLRYVQTLTSPSGTCVGINVPLPFMERHATLPCLSRVILDADASDFLQVYHVITTGLIAYWIMVKLFAHIRSFKKPDEDKVEVLEL